MRHVRPLRESEWDELAQMSQQEIGRVALRAQLILLSARGYTAPEIAEIQQISDVTVYKWMDRFDAEGPEGLFDRPRSGRPRKLDADAEAVLEETVSAPPTEQEYTFTYWTLPLLAHHLEQTLGLSLCCETIRTYLHRLGFRWRSPRWAVVREDSEAKERMWTIARTIWQADAETLVLIEDETILKTLPPLRRMWMRQGQQVRIPTPAQNDDVCLYGALALDSGEWMHAFYEKGTSEHTIAYLEQILDHYPQQQLLLIWDQASYHTSKMVTDWLSEQPRIDTLLLPKYAAELNPDESIWRQLKDRVAANLTRSLDAIKQAVDTFFEGLNSDQLIQMAGLSL